MRQPSGEVRVGSAVIHSSHKPLGYRGVWICSKCGAYCSVAAGQKSSPKLLVRPCTGLLQGAGKDYWSRFSKGQTPKPGMKWPEAT